MNTIISSLTAIRLGMLSDSAQTRYPSQPFLAWSINLDNELLRIIKDAPAATKLILLGLRSRAKKFTGADGELDMVVAVLIDAKNALLTA